MMQNAEHDTSSESAEGIQPPAYYCRGCGDPLPQGSTARFHPECLKADKRRRIAERRQRETQRLHRWLQRRKCPDCGATLEKLAQVSPRHSLKGSCETSHGTAEPFNSKERPISAKKRESNKPRGSKSEILIPKCWRSLCYSWCSGFDAAPAMIDCRALRSRSSRTSSLACWTSRRNNLILARMSFEGGSIGSSVFV